QALWLFSDHCRGPSARFFRTSPLDGGRACICAPCIMLHLLRILAPVTGMTELASVHQDTCNGQSDVTRSSEPSRSTDPYLNQSDSSHQADKTQTQATDD
ncbi:hypothetical protein JMJ77_0015424, partial [Colletotrichum scovillei]